MTTPTPETPLPADHDPATPVESPETNEHTHDAAPTEPVSLAQRLDLTTWAAIAWSELLERTADPTALEPGFDIAKRRRGPIVSVAPGEISATVPDPPRSRRTVSFITAAADHAHWEHAAKRVADQPVLSAQVIAGELPPDVANAFSASALSLVPADHEIALRRGRTRLEWDENVCAAAIAFAKRLNDDPGLLLTFRGMTPEAFRELVRQCAALSSAGNRGAAAYAQRPPIGPDQEPPALELCLDAFWTAGPELAEVQTPIRAPQHPHSLLRRLGASPFDAAPFPLIGLLATCYDLMSEAEIRRARDAERIEDEPDHH